MAEQNLWLTEQRPWPPEGLARMCAFGGDLLSSELKRLAHMISTDLRAQEIATAVDGPEPVFRMDFSTSTMADGALRLRRLYWSVQKQIGGRFVARTFAYHHKTGDGIWFDFPEDPDLPGAASVLAEVGGFVVLRYIPMRRLTVLQHSEEAGPVILKFKRMDRFAEAAGLLDAVNLAATKSCESFTTPQLLFMQHADGMFAQTYLPGMPIASGLLLNGISFPHIARVLAELAALKVSGLPVLTHSQMAQDMAAMAQWVACMLPKAATALTEVVDTLVRATPEDGDMVFCHGDMGADQILIDVSRQWALLDFDRAHMGSPYRDIASLMVKWQRDQGLVISADEVVDAVNVSGLRKLGKRALHWHLACMEIRQLPGLMKIDYGSLQGNLKGEKPFNLRREYFDTPMPGGESLRNVWERLHGASGEILALLREQACVATVGHYWTNRLLASQLTGRTLETSLDKGGYRPENAPAYAMDVHDGLVHTGFWLHSNPDR